MVLYGVYCKKCTKRDSRRRIGFASTLGFVGLAVFLNSDVKWIYYPAQNVCVLHVLAFLAKEQWKKRSNLDLNFNLTGKTLRKLRWKAHEELADVIEFNSDMIRISNGLPTAIYIHFISL